MTSILNTTYKQDKSFSLYRWLYAPFRKIANMTNKFFFLRLLVCQFRVIFLPRQGYFSTFQQLNCEYDSTEK